LQLEQLALLACWKRVELQVLLVLRLGRLRLGRLPLQLRLQVLLWHVRLQLLQLQLLRALLRLLLPPAHPQWGLQHHCHCGPLLLTLTLRLLLLVLVLVLRQRCCQGLLLRWVLLVVLVLVLLLPAVGHWLLPGQRAAAAPQAALVG
jgi:hypothetical protein